MKQYIRGLYSFNGRFTRSQFLGYNILNIAISVILGLPLLFVSSSDNPGVEILAAIAMLIVFALGLWSNYAVISKRLHDLGYSALNSIWILLLDLGSVLLEKPAPVLSILFDLVLFGIISYLLFKPGEIYHNHFGDSTI